MRTDKEQNTKKLKLWLAKQKTKPKKTKKDG